MNKRVLACVSLALTGVLASCVPLSVADDNQPLKRLETGGRQCEWAFDHNQDMQLPELPTGCEATALATLMRMNGFSVTKSEVADAMPKSGGSDFVTAFWGDPYSKTGWACMAPCSTMTANSFFEIDEEYAAIDLTGLELGAVPTPYVAWVTIGIENPAPSTYEQDGYVLMNNPHCVTVLVVSEEYVSCVDPLRGLIEYPREKFEAVFNAMGRQSVYIDGLNEALSVERELKGAEQCQVTSADS